MIKEIYCRMPADPNYDSSKIDSNNDIENILQRIRVCLGTKPGKVLGSPYFGIDLEEYLFNMSYNADDIKNEIKAMIDEYVTQVFDNKYDIDVDVNFGKEKDTNNDYMVIDININNEKVMGIIVD